MYENHPLHFSNLPKDHVKQQELQQELIKQTEREVSGMEEIKQLKEKYTAESIERFINHYACTKTNAILNGWYNLESLEYSPELRYREETEHVLEMIQQKKLFNYQCLWRAEKETTPYVQTSYDFYYWEDNAVDCPFVKPVTEGEIKVMQQFLRDNNYNDQTQSWMHGWQDYDEFHSKDAEDNFDSLPEWYEFYDGRMGTGSLMLLPDLREPKDAVYLHRGDEAKMAKQKEEYEKKPQPPPVHKPTLNFYDDQWMLEFVRRHEDAYITRLFEGHYKKMQEIRERDDEEITDAIHILCEAKYPVYMPGGFEWREAIMRCAQQFINGIISEELETIYQEYIIKQKSGISSGTNHLKAINEQGNAKYYRKTVLLGRKMSGEPEDFNY